MMPFVRMLLAATALLTSGVVQLAVASTDDVCCAEEQGASCPDCPPGLACACCAMRGAVHAEGPEIAPATSPGIAIAVAADEPSLGTSAADIFHPPRG